MDFTWTVGLDGSTGSAAALRWAASLAGERDERVVPVAAWHVPFPMWMLSGRRPIDVDRAGIKAEVEVHAAEAVQALASRISIVHAVDGVLDLAAGRGISVPVGEGTADFPALLGRLEDIPYRGPFVVGRPDMRPEFAVRELHQSLEYLRNL